MHRWRNLISLSLASILWLTALFILAYPDQALRSDFSKLAKEFLSGSYWRVYLIPFVLLIDVFVSIILGRYFLSRAYAGVMIASSLVYILVAIVIPTVNISEEPASQVPLFVVAFFTLFVVRVASFVETRRFLSTKAIAKIEYD